MKIRNINGKSQNICKCGSWLKHWENFSNQSVPKYCPENHCSKQDLDGAHVQKDDSKDNIWYIYPLCRKHNTARGQTLEVSSFYKLVSANVNETCE